MAGVKEYPDIIKHLLTEYASIPRAYGQIEMETIFDDAQQHYELLAVGWDGRRRVHGSVIHLDIKGEKVWLQHDSTDAKIAEQLVDMGIPKDRLVLGFQPENVRPDTGFAVK